MEPLLFIYNPHAGGGKVKNRLSEILDAFTYRDFLPTVYSTRGPGDATVAARELGPKFPRLVCCGGDGTLHEVVTALMEMEQPPILGYVPAGTTNDFSRNLNLPRDMGLAAGTAVSGPTVHCDMGRFNGAPYVYVAAFGAFTEVSYGTPQKYKDIFGHLAYILGGIGSLGSLRPQRMKVEWDEGEVEDDFIFGMVSNTRSVGGFKWTGDGLVKLDDGLFEVVLVKEPKNPLDVHRILSSVMTHNPVEGGPLLGFKAARVKFTAPDSVPWTLDGEYGGSHIQAEVVACHKALEICHRPKTPAKR